MANVNSKFGARITGVQQMAQYTGAIHPYTVLASDVTALFLGDFVKHTGTAAIGTDNKDHPVVTQAEASDVLVGIVVGFLVTGDNLNRIYRPASELATVLVCDDPYVSFEIQASGSLVADNIGENAEIKVSAGDIYTGLSGMELDTTTLTASSAQLRVLDLSVAEDNEFGEYAKVRCMINEHLYKQTAGV